MEIVRAGPGDWERLRDVRLLALRTDPDAFGSTFDREADHDEAAWRTWMTGWDGARDQVLFAAHVRDTWIGVALGVRWSADPGVVHVYAMWVAPSMRQHGVGRALIESVVGWARGLGATAVELAVTEGNERAERLYREAGFEDTGDRAVLREGTSAETSIMRRRL